LAIDDPKDAARASYTDTFAQIAADLKLAIETMPNNKFTDIPTSQYGHANKWVAQAYLGRVFLLYTGYMTNIEGQGTSELPVAGGGSLSKSDVAAYLQDCISNSGHRLASDFRNLWPYSYVNQAAGRTILPWAAAEGLSWVGQDGHSPTYGTGNYETMFVQRFSFGNWSWGQQYNNRLCLFGGMRGNGALTPFGEGWGWFTVNSQLWENWDNDDPRKVGSILEVGQADQGTEAFELRDNVDHHTGYLNKKYTSLQYDGKGLFNHVYGWSDTDMQLRHAQDFILMRFADVLLMHSEITETADGINAVRARAGLDPVGYSLENLKKERMYELAFEGLRWFDLVRWGDVNTAFNYTINVKNAGPVDYSYSPKYRPETKGLLPIPETEVRLSGGVYEQNPGW